MDGKAFVDLVEECGDCAAWVDTLLAGWLRFVDDSDFYVFLLFLGISFTNNDALIFLLNTSLILQEYLIRWPLATLIGVYGPQGEDCTLYLYQLPCKWGQLLGVLTGFAMLLSLYKQRVAGYLSVLSCTYAAYLITFAPIYRQIVTPVQMIASFVFGCILSLPVFLFCVWLLRTYGDYIVTWPIVNCFSFENKLANTYDQPCVEEKEVRGDKAASVPAEDRASKFLFW